MKVVLALVFTGIVVGLPSDLHNAIMAGVDGRFKHFDTNNDGRLQVMELETAFFRADLNNDGRVSFAEYIDGVPYYSYFTAMFFELDYNKDGYLDRSSILGEYEMMDTNRDNEVSRVEFDNYYTRVALLAFHDYNYLLPNGTLTAN